MRVDVYSLLGQTEGGRKVLLLGVAGACCRARLPQRALSCYKRLKKSLFVKFETIQPLFCYLSDLLTKTYSRVWISMINFVD